MFRAQPLILTGEAELHGWVFPLCQLVCGDRVRLAAEDGEGAVVDVGEFFDVACLEQSFLEVPGNGDDTVRLHECDVGDRERGEDVLGSCPRARASIGGDGHTALFAAEDRELVDDGGDRLVHDGERGCCA